jgi:hypothetical protein
MARRGAGLPDQIRARRAQRKQMLEQGGEAPTRNPPPE